MQNYEDEDNLIELEELRLKNINSIPYDLLNGGFCSNIYGNNDIHKKSISNDEGILQKSEQSFDTSDKTEIIIESDDYDNGKLFSKTSFESYDENKRKGEIKMDYSEYDEYIKQSEERNKRMQKDKPEFENNEKPENTEINKHEKEDNGLKKVEMRDESQEDKKTKGNDSDLFEKKKKKRVFPIILLIILAILLILGAYFFMEYNKMIKPMATKENAQDIKFEVKKGDTLNDVSEELEKVGLIRDKEFFKLYWKLNKISDFKSGKYKISTSADVKEIVDILNQGKVDTERIVLTIIEGSNMQSIAKKVAQITETTEKDFFEYMTDEKFLNELIEKYWFLTDEIKNKDIYYALEGYLFPETYFFTPQDATIKNVIYTMLDQMEKELAEYKPLYVDRDGNMLHSEKYTIGQRLALASVVEKEANSKEDKKNVAGLFYNRLKLNMSLGSDVTTYYAIKVNLYERDLTINELNMENKYNTRGPNMQGKLPIGPICSPSREAIQAAFKPNKIDAIFFVSDKDGKLYFSKTLSEHDAIIDKLKAENKWHVYK